MTRRSPPHPSAWTALAPLAALAALAALALLATACDRPDRAPAPPPPADPWVLESRAADPRWAVGRDAFRTCASCHLADGGGRPDGAIPRLAGQHAAILDKRLRALRDGTRDVPAMWPFARALSDDEVRAVADYIASLPRPTRVPIGTGSADDATVLAGSTLATTRCAACHGPRGEGNPALGAPRLCGQHFGYLVRRLTEMSEPGRADVDPRMRAIAVTLTAEDRVAAGTFLSRLDCDADEVSP
ncbi:MAG: c-type cytochrome [Deltaproteobacteria bacterium]|nr:c-type cytochrome [Deltaproteobacteria bacterium]